MINLLNLFDLINLFASFAALIILFAFWKDTLWRDAKYVLFGLLVLIIFRSFNHILVLSGITMNIGAIEEFAELLEPLWWGFFLYTGLQEINTRDALESKSKLEATFEAIGDGISIQDTDFKIVYQNQVNKDIMGEHIGEFCYLAYGDSEDVCDECPLRRSFEDGQVHDAEKCIIRGSVKRHILIKSSPLKDATGKIIQGIEVVRDITDLKKADEALLESNERYRRLVENDPYGIIIHDLQKYTYANEAAAKIFGVDSPEQLIGKGVLDLVHPDYIDTVTKRVQKEKKGDKVPLIESKIIKNDGTPCDIEVLTFSVIYKNKLEVHMVLRDITERIKAEKELKKYTDELTKTNEELKTLDKMKDEFLSNVSHELKTPLISIEGYSEVLRDETLGKLNQQQKKAVNTVIRNADRLERLINSILYLSIEEAGRMRYYFRSIQIADVIEKSILDMLPQIRTDDLKIKKELAYNLPLIEVDEDRLMQVMINLIGNAIKFTPSGEIVISANEENDNIHITVSDTGIGISKNIINNLFERFYQGDASTKRKYGGTGLGLHICKLIIDAHNGKIWVESEEGVGTTIHVTLPKNH